MISMASLPRSVSPTPAKDSPGLRRAHRGLCPTLHSTCWPVTLPYHSHTSNPKEFDSAEHACGPGMRRDIGVALPFMSMIQMDLPPGTVSLSKTSYI